MTWSELPIVKEAGQYLHDMWRLGWNERNSGNVSIRLKKEEYAGASDLDYSSEWKELPFSVPQLAGEYFLVSGTGEYFRNAIYDFKKFFGIIRINESGSSWQLLAGFEKKETKGHPTSELPSHMMCHEVRKIKTGNRDRVILHVHATNLIALMGVKELDEKAMSYALWNACTESIVIFPAGIGILPWMMPGSLEIAEASCKKMEQFSLVLWAQHGVYGADETLERVFGLIETAEKSAEVLLKIYSVGDQINFIGSKNLKAIADRFGVQIREDFF